MRALSLGRDLAVGQTLEREPALALCAAVSVRRESYGFLTPEPAECCRVLSEDQGKPKKLIKIYSVAWESMALDS